MYQPDSFMFDVPRPDRLSRLFIFIKWLLVLPHYFILYFFSFAVGVVHFFAWWVILFAGSYPAGMWKFVYRYTRWNARLNVYIWLLRDEYPPFGEAPYPLEFHLERPESQSRLLLFVRIVAAIPLAIWLSVLGIYAAILLFISWFAILFTGNIPAGIFETLAGILGYSTRVGVYLSNLTDEWPGFGMR